MIPAPTVPNQSAPGAAGVQNPNPSPTAPAGWDASTYANFKAANPSLEPTAQDTAMMRGTPVITPGSLGSTPSPMQVPPPNAPFAGPALQSAVDGAHATFQQQLDANAAQAKGDMGSSLSDLLRARLAGGKAEYTNTEYANAGVDQAQQDLRSVNNQIAAEKNTLQNTIDNLRTNTGGMFGTGVDDQIQKATNASLSRQADLAVIQLSKQGAYDSAKAIADRAIAAKVEERQNQIDGLQAIYEANKDLFTTAEQQQFQSAQAERTNQLQIAAHKEEADYDEKIKQNDPLYQAQVREANARASSLGNNGTLNGKPQTDTERQVQGFAERTNQSDNIIAKFGDQFTGVASYGGALMPNFLKSSDRQQYEQAQRDFVNAVLRRESGAAISSSEFDNAKQQYFPQPGDSPEVIAQKAQNRQTVVNSLYKQSNVQRAALPGQIIEDATGARYVVGDDGKTLNPLVK